MLTLGITPQHVKLACERRFRSWKFMTGVKSSQRLFGKFTVVSVRAHLLNCCAKAVAGR